MKSYIPFLPLFAVLVVPALLPQVIHPALKPVPWISAYGTSASTNTISVLYATYMPHSTSAYSYYGELAEISQSGALKVNWARTRQVAEQCFSKEGSHDSYEICFIARSLVAAHDGTWEELK